ncbi:hypothetical protein DL546_002828 [Coniochaeta pulveracea]|uniref:ZN622/Rei1/Reh1 zinc finger C2H2-type domain-containing protein n=1 Tax=Coniochaeta pulveracea TaxID=177199 RepID=A0A420XZP7_9PEZI|nr:hypothetical protein DL546_002828 [Coniochaeta pulveracea]
MADASNGRQFNGLDHADKDKQKNPNDSSMRYTQEHQDSKGGETPLGTNLSNLTLSSPFGPEEEDEHDENKHEDTDITPAFNPTQCLFCPVIGTSFSANLEHMQYKHSLFIPERQHLVLDEEALVKYCHLVVFGYFECLYCGSQRNTAQAAQQHMVGKGHCRINLDREGSEFRDFYDFDDDGSDSGSSAETDEDEEDSDDDAEEDNVPAETSCRRSRSAAPVQLDAHSLRLFTGKVLTHRSQAARLRAEKHHARQKRIEAAVEVSSSTSRPEDPTPRPSQQPQDATPLEQAPESKRLAKMTAKFGHHLTTMRAQDRLALAHLPTYQQRALVAKAKAQVEYARKAENEMLLKIQLQANKTLKK